MSDALVTAIQLSLREMGSHKLRTAITSIGVFIGCIALIANIAITRGMNIMLQKQMHMVGSVDIVSVNAKAPINIEEKISFARSPGLSYSQLQRIAQQVTYIETILPEKNLGGSEIQAQGRSRYTRVLAVNRAWLEQNDIPVGKGQLLSEQVREREVVIGEMVAKRLGIAVEPGITKVVLNDRPYTVVGVVTAGERDGRSYRSYISYDRYVLENGLSAEKASSFQIKLRSQDLDTYDQIVSDIKQRLIQLHRGVEDFEIELNRDKIQEKKDRNRGMRILMVIISAVTLLVASVSIVNIMFGTLDERIHEFGIRKALGAPPFVLFFQMIFEAVALCLIAGGVGLLLGSLITSLPQDFLPIEVALYPVDWLWAVGFIFLTGVVSGFAPAVKAARIEPIEAIR